MRSMRKRKGKIDCMKDQRGFTLVELLIGIVILSLVIIAIGGFIVVGSKSYAAANTEIMLQQEAQLAMNQISDVIIDTTRSVNYAGLSGSGWVSAEKDADFVSDVTDKSLILCNGVDTVDADGNVVTEEGSGNNKNYQFYYSKDDETLYYSEVEVTKEGKAENFPEDNRVVLAEYVTDFSVDLTQVVEKRVVQISMTYENNNKTYSTSNNITIRNKVGINEIDVENLDKRVELSVTPKEASVILEPGEAYHFSTPKVSGKNVLDKSVTWSFSDETPHHSGTVFTDPTNGNISISTSETATFFKVVITTNATDSEGHHATAEVIVYVKRATDVNIRKTADDKAENGANEVSAGKGFTLSAEAIGNKLGVSCGGCSEGTAEDKLVIPGGAPYGWTILQGEAIVTMDESNNQTARFTVSSEAKKGDIIEIRATSLLSVKKGYTLDTGDGAVSGTIILTVAEEEETPIHIDFDGGDLSYGERDMLLNMVGVDSDDPAFLVIVRVKENPEAPIADDMVMVYATEGTNARLMPDTWLLNMNQEYRVTIQVIDILSDPELYKDGDPTNQKGDNKTEEYYALRELLHTWSWNQVEGTSEYWELKKYVDDTFWQEYLDGLDSNGCYRGEGRKYPKYSNLVPGQIKVPKIGITSYLDGEPHFDGVDVKTMYTVQKGPLFIPTEVGEITSTRWWSGPFSNYTFYNVYSGESENSSEWIRLYYLPEKDLWGENAGEWLSYKNINNYQGIGRIGNTLLFDSSGLPNRSSVGINVNFGADYTEKKKAIGTYHYVPGFAYVNQPANVYLKISANYKKFDGKQYCYDYESTVNFTVKDGGNLKLWAYTDDGFKYGQIFFPEPSDTKQFGNEVPMGRAFSYDKTYLLDNNGQLHNVTFSEAFCEYNAAAERYELKLYYDYTDTWGITKKCYAGTFWCGTNGTEWAGLEPGTYDEQLKSGNTTITFSNGNMGSLKFTMDGKTVTGNGYMPLPSEPTFGSGTGNSDEYNFTLNDETPQEKTWGYFYFKENGSSQATKYYWDKIQKTYDKSTDTYTLKCTGIVYGDSSATITIECKGDGTAWKQIN